MKKQILLDNLEQLETKEYTKLTPILVPETFEELKELCKELDNVDMTENAIFLIGINFRKNGEVFDNDSVIIAESRTPAQMWQIIKSLIGEER